LELERGAAAFVVDVRGMDERWREAKSKSSKTYNIPNAKNVSTCVSKQKTGPLYLQSILATKVSFARKMIECHTLNERQRMR
jgi:hypothetical protein